MEREESALITRHGKTVARISPEAAIDRERVQRATEGMRALRQKIGKLSLEEIFAARDEGRAGARLMAFVLHTSISAVWALADESSPVRGPSSGTLEE